VDALARRYVELLVATFRAQPRPLAGVPVVLRELRSRGYRLALASSAEPELIATNVASLGLAPMLEATVSGTEVARGKPAPDVFLETARRLGVAPAACLVVEDSRNGLLAAKAAGMACAVVPCGYTLDQDFHEADHRLGRLDELLAVLAAPGPATRGV
jgi:HAD superfamily hydrolase (TIGR01509 family)